MSVSNANRTRELQVLGGFAAVSILLCFLPVWVPRFNNALKEGLESTNVLVTVMATLTGLLYGALL